LRLLLDEHYSPKVARALRERCHDVAAASERDDLRGASDEELLSVAASERRALVTADVRSFIPLALKVDFSGIVFARRRATVGRLVYALESLLDSRPAEHALRNRVHWLRPA
jgi:hypothetical protein